jgi:hypothetical protein
LHSYATFQTSENLSMSDIGDFRSGAFHSVLYIESMVPACVSSRSRTGVNDPDIG